MKFIDFGPDGGLIGRYDSDINGVAIPPGAIEVSDETFWMTINSDGMWAISSGVVVKAPIPSRPISVIRAELCEAVKAIRNRRCSEGGYLVAGKWFHSDTQSRIQQLGLVLLGASIPPGTQWKTMDGSFVAMTPALAQQILAAAAASDQAIFSAAEAHLAAINASLDPETYDYLVGWPPAFVG